MTDRYSKAMLTLIAFALVAIVAQNAIGPVGATGGVQKVVICSAQDTNICAAVFEKDRGSTTYGFVATTN